MLTRRSCCCSNIDCLLSSLPLAMGIHVVTSEPSARIPSG